MESRTGFSAPNSLVESLAGRFGPVMGGRDLYQAIGFRTQKAFDRAIRKNLAGVRVFNLANRRGKYAFTAEVANWLLAEAARNCSAPPIDIKDEDADMT